MNRFTTKIDVSAARTGRLVLLADGAAAARLTVRLDGDALAIADGPRVIARATAVPAAAAVLVRARRTADLALLRPDGRKFLHHGIIDAGD